MMRKKITTTAIIILILLIITGLLVSYVRNPLRNSIKITNSGNMQIYSSRLVGRNIQFPTLVSSSTLRFFTGSSFADFDLNSLSSKSLTSEVALPAVDSVKYKGNYALVKVEKTTPNDDLYNQANSQARQSASWWLFNLTSDKVKQLTTSRAGYSVIDANWDIQQGQNVFVLLQNGSASHQLLEKWQISFTPLASSSTHNLKLIGSTQSGELVRQSSSLLMAWSGEKFSHIMTNPNPISIMSDGQHFIYADNSSIKNSSIPGTPANLYEYDLGTPKRLTKILDSADNTQNYSAFQNGLLVLPDPGDGGSAPSTIGSLLINTSRGINQYSLNLFGGSEILGHIKNSFLVTQPSSGQTSFLLTNLTNDLFIVSNDSSIQQQQSPYPIVFLPSNSVPLSNATTAFDVLNNRLDIFFNPGANTPLNRSAIINQLKAYGDPNQLVKVWHFEQNANQER